VSSPIAVTGPNRCGRDRHLRRGRGGPGHRRGVGHRGPQPRQAGPPRFICGTSVGIAVDVSTGSGCSRACPSRAAVPGPRSSDRLARLVDLGPQPNLVLGCGAPRGVIAILRSCEGSAAGPSQQPGEAGGSLIREAPVRAASSHDNDGTGRHRQTARVRQARRGGVPPPVWAGTLMKGTAVSFSAVRLNHAVLFVAGLERSVRFHTDLFGMDVVARETRANAPFLRLPRSDNHHDLACSAWAPPTDPSAATPSGCTTWQGSSTPPARNRASRRSDGALPCGPPVRCRSCLTGPPRTSGARGGIDQAEISKPHVPAGRAARAEEVRAPAVGHGTQVWRPAVPAPAR
jgi:hypothetical protein